MGWLWLAIIGCKTGTTVPTDQADTDTDADTDADSDADTDADSDADADADTDSDTDADIEPVTDALGAVTLFQFQPGAVLGHQEQMLLVGLFTSDPQGMLNPNECFPLLYNACVQQLPTGPDSFVDLEVGYEGDASTSLNAGDTILLGAMGMQHQQDALFGDFYRTFATPPYPAEQRLALRMADGAFGTWFGTGEITTPPRMQLLEPDPFGDPARLMDGGQLHFAWEPDLSGQTDVELVIYGTGEPGANRVRRLYNLQDDGSFDLDVDGLFVNRFNRELVASFVRVAREEHLVNGNLMRVSTRSEVRLELAHPDTQGRTLVQGADVCGEGPVLGPGRYYGDLGGSEDTFGLPSDSCTGTEDTGIDQIIAVELQPGERLRAVGEIFADDAALYVITDCTDPAGSCVAGSDYGDASETETVTYTNESPESVTVQLVIDSHDADQTLYLLDLFVDLPAPTEQLPDDCAGAVQFPPFGESVDLVVDLRDAIDHLDPYLNGCASHRAPGPDQMFPVSVGPGQALRVEADGAVVLYLLEDCTNEIYCDAGAPPYGSLYYENLFADAQLRYLVVDDPGQPAAQGPMDLRLVFESIDTILPVDTCAELADAPLLTTGSYTFRGTVEGFSDDLDLEDPGPSCTGYSSSGAEGLVRVQLQPGETIEVEYGQDDPGDGVVYLLTDCNDSTTTLACDDKINGTERIRYEHTGTEMIEVALVLDNWSGSPWAPRSASFDLHVVIE